MNPETAVERFKMPFAQSASKGERHFEAHPMDECFMFTPGEQSIRSSFDWCSGR